jgi:hypothetical protein
VPARQSVRPPDCPASGTITKPWEQTNPIPRPRPPPQRPLPLPPPMPTLLAVLLAARGRRRPARSQSRGLRLQAARGQSEAILSDRCAGSPC